MALIPNTFEAGTVASAPEVNDNFQSVVDVVGASSTASRMILPGDVVIGPRENVQLTSEIDTVESSTNSYFQIGWNVEQYNSSGWKLRRFITGSRGTAVRVGINGFEVLATSRTSGNLTDQLDKLFGVTPTSDGDGYAYLKLSTVFTSSDAQPATIEDHRMTLVMYDVPKVIYESTTINYSSAAGRLVTDYGVTHHAKAVLLSFSGTAGSSDAEISFTKAQSTRHAKHSLKCYALAGKKGACQGIVALGESGAYVHRFVEERTAQWNSASLYIQGFYY